MTALIIALLALSNLTQWVLIMYTNKWEETVDEELNMIGYNISSFDDKITYLDGKVNWCSDMYERYMVMQELRGDKE